MSSPSYVIVQSPTQYLPITGHRDVSLLLSLEWHAWLSSSGNNCHAVHRSLSSGASVYDCTLGFYLVPYCQPHSPTPMEYAFPPSLEWHVWQGRRSIYYKTRPTEAGENFTTEKNILLISLATGRVHYCPQVGYHNTNWSQLSCGQDGLNSPLISNSFNVFSTPFRRVQTTPTTICITIIHIFHRIFFIGQGGCISLSFHFVIIIIIIRGCPRGVMVKAVDCGIVVREFVLQSRYYIHFRANTLGKGMNPLILPVMG